MRNMRKLQIPDTFKMKLPVIKQHSSVWLFKELKRVKTKKFIVLFYIFFCGKRHQWRFSWFWINMVNNIAVIEHENTIHLIWINVVCVSRRKIICISVSMSN